MANNTNDQVFAKKRSIIKSFEFNEEVAAVFDDMICRSVPFYQEIHRVLYDLLNRSYRGGTIVDLGCSTGSTLEMIDDFFITHKRPRPKLVGLDNSRPMLDKAKEKLAKRNIRDLSLIHDDITQMKFEPTGLVIMNYTLQFIPINKRPELLRRIYQSLERDGLFVLSEKIKCQDQQINDLIIELYYDFKRRNGYSELEISQKREALENVLIPLTPEKQIEQLKEAGFKKVEMIFRWYNFACYLGIK